ncbi:MAG: XRE family transcriptional regulator [Lysobacterales bacterium]|nr:MAG: XRE family transcriptional regulator [Xanthomonadales bacterium]
MQRNQAPRISFGAHVDLCHLAPLVKPEHCFTVNVPCYISLLIQQGGDLVAITIGQRVGEALQAKGLNQSQLAAKVRTSGATISRVIAGKLGLSVELAEQIAGITGVRAGWLLTGELPMRPGQDLAAVAEASYRAGWQDAIASVERDLKVLARQGSKQSPAVSPRGSAAALAAAKRHREELEALGLVHPPAVPPAHRRKRA